MFNTGSNNEAQKRWTKANIYANNIYPLEQTIDFCLTQDALIHSP